MYKFLLKYTWYDYFISIGIATEVLQVYILRCLPTIKIFMVKPRGELTLYTCLLLIVYLRFYYLNDLLHHHPKLLIFTIYIIPSFFTSSQASHFLSLFESDSIPSTEAQLAHVIHYTVWNYI